MGMGRMKLMRRWVMGVAALAGLAAFVPGAHADEAMWRNFRGRIVFTDIALAPESNFENAALMTTALKRLERTTIDQTAGFWRVHVLAFLDRAGGDAHRGAARVRRVQSESATRGARLRGAGRARREGAAHG